VIDHEDAMVVEFPDLRLKLVPMLVDLKIEIIKRLKRAQQQKSPPINVNVTDEIKSLRPLSEMFLKCTTATTAEWPVGKMTAISAGLVSINRLVIARIMALESTIEKIKDDDEQSE
jgi:hypothetical protein